MQGKLEVIPKLCAHKLQQMECTLLAMHKKLQKN